VRSIASPLYGVQEGAIKLDLFRKIFAGDLSKQLVLDAVKTIK
jgi:hypothetical protein